MCINCNLLTPLSDKVADILGVEKRKYLVHVHEVSMIDIHRELSPHMGSNTNLLLNYMTFSSFRIDYSSYTKKQIEFEYKGTIINITLYEGKIKMIAPIPLIKLYDPILIKGNIDNFYLELFDTSDIPALFTKNMNELLDNCNTSLSYSQYMKPTEVLSCINVVDDELVYNSNINVYTVKNYLTPTLRIL